jgi:two-component system chemotaxis sensor kinase CheA
VLVRVRQAPATDMPGVRALILLKRMSALGELGAVSPSTEQLQAASAPVEFAFRLRTSAAPGEISELVRATGDVAAVTIGEPVHAEEPQASAPVAPRAAGAARGQRSVRVDVARLDGLMNLVGELVIARGRMAQLASRIGAPSLDDAMSQTGRLIADLQDEIVAARLVPVSQVFDRFPRLVRDAAKATGKEVEFVIEGKDIELDRSLLEELGDPVVHLLRNAIDHGLEPAAERTSHGKSATGRLVLSASRDRSAVLVRVEDDGRGVDRDRVRARAGELGVEGVPAGALGDEDLLRLIARPGLSTAERVTDLSGRGVGVDAVITRVRQLGGTVELRTARGEGTSWTLRLPLTLAIVRALLARVDTEVYALPVTHVAETLDLESTDRQSVRGQDVFVLRGEVLPLLHLRALVGLPAGDVPAPQVVVLARGERRSGIVVDELLGHQEIVVKQYDAARGAAQLFSGATILSDGAPALIIDVGSVL